MEWTDVYLYIYTLVYIPLSERFRVHSMSQDINIVENFHRSHRTVNRREREGQEEEQRG